VFNGELSGAISPLFRRQDAEKCVTACSPCRLTFGFNHPKDHGHIFYANLVII